MAKGKQCKKYKKLSEIIEKILTTNKRKQLIGEKDANAEKTAAVKEPSRYYI